MTKTQQIQIAKDFISKHKNSNVIDWFSQCTDGKTNDEKYLEIYSKLEFGTYGECRNNEEYDEEGEVVAAATEFEVEISPFDSKTGNPIIFGWKA